MLDKSCNTFIEELASKSPVPGGGGASAFAGSLGMALGCMVGNLTIGKKKYQDVEPDILKLLEESEKIITKFKDLVTKDAEVFYPLSQAYRLPQNTDEEKAEKEAILQHALIAATQVPLDIAKTCLAAIELIEEYALKGTRIAISDAGVGAIFCKSALQGAKLNVLINTKIMKDIELKNSVETELEEIVSVGIEKSDRIYQYVEDILKR